MGVMPNDNTVQMLKKLVPLNLLSEEDLEQLLQSASFNRDKSGTYLFRQGDTDYHNVYLLSGQVALLDKMREVDRVTAGSETARFPLAHQIPRKNSVRAVGRVEYVLIDNRKLSELLVRSSDDDYKVTDLNAIVTDDWMTQLLQSNVFQQIPAANIQGVIMRMEEVEVKRGQSVVKQGGEGDYFYLIHQGQCVVQRKEEGAEKPIELAKLGPGDSFGEEALLSDSPRNSSVRMLTEGILLRLAKEDFIEFVKRPLARGVGYTEALSLVKDGAVWLDVRPPDEYETGHIGKSVSLPLNTLRYQAPNLAVDQHYVICCGDGQLSATAAFLLTDRGYNVSVLEGGLRSAPEEILIQGEGKGAETSAKVISLHSGEELAEDATPANGSEELEDLKGRLAEANNKIKLLGARFHGYKDKQQKEAAQRQAELKAQKVILDSTRSRLEELRGKRNAEKKSQEQLEQDRNTLNTTLEEALQELSKANSSASDLGSRLQAQEDSNRELLKDRDGLQGVLDRLQKEQKQQQVESKKQKELTSTQHQEADERVTQLEQQHQAVLAGLEEELTLSRNSLEEVVATRAALEKTIEDLHQEQTGIEQQHDTAVSEVEQQLEKLRQELAASEDKNQSTLTELEQLNNRVNESESGLETSRQAHLESEAKLQELQQAHEQSEAEFKDLQQSAVELAELQDVHQQVEAELKQSHNDRREIESELEQLKADSRRQAGIEQQHDAAVSEVEQQLEELHQELAASEDKNQSALAELEQLNNRVNESESGLETSRQVRLESETKLQELQQAHEQSEAELKDLQHTHQQSEVELTELQDIHQQAEAELKQSHSVRRQIESELEQLKADSRRQAAEQPHDAAVSEVEQQLEKLRQELAASEDKNQSALTELEQLNGRVNESEADSEASRQVRLESEAKLQELRQAHEQSEAELEELKANSHKVETELQHERSLRQDAEDKLQQGVASTAPDDQGDMGALKSELVSLTEALKEADFAYDEIREQAELLSEEKESTAELMAELERNSAAAREEIAALTSELEQLRLTQGEGPSAADDEEAVTKEAEALREELKLVQLHSSTEIEELNTALLTARADLKEIEVTRGFEKADEESLRLEMDELRESSRRWEQRLTEADSKSRGFEDAIEDRDERIDRITLELEEARRKYSEVESVRQQHEERLNLLRESAGQEAATDGYVDPRLAGPSSDLHLDDLHSGPSSRGSMLLWLFLGAVICFAVVDGVMILAGRGELVTGLLQGDGAVEIEPAVSDRRVAGRNPVPERASRTVPAPSVIAEDKSIPAPEEATAEGAEQEPAWSMLTDIEFGPAMVRLKGGSFTMGSNTNQVSGDEWPAHAISMPAFAISQEEVTFDEYDRFAQATGRRLPNDEGWGRGRRPVINVSWDDAVAYAEWLSERTGKNYRLPTESEWEFALRGGSDSPYWWGYQVEDARANCFDCGSEWDRKSSAPVGSFPPNNFGLHDMAGNVREWVQDCYHPNYSGAPADGSAWLDPGCAVRVVRGGAYNKTSDSMRSAWRGYFKQDTRLSVAGFRVVRELR